MAVRTNYISERGFPEGVAAIEDLRHNAYHHFDMPLTSRIKSLSSGLQSIYPNKKFAVYGEYLGYDLGNQRPLI